MQKIAHSETQTINELGIILHGKTSLELISNNVVIETKAEIECNHVFFLSHPYTVAGIYTYRENYSTILFTLTNHLEVWPFCRESTAISIRKEEAALKSTDCSRLRGLFNQLRIKVLPPNEAQVCHKPPLSPGLHI